MTVGGLLASLGINDNKIISGVSNYIPSPPNPRYAVKKASEATFMSISGFVCNYPCSMLCDNGKRSGLERLVKDIAFWYGERVQSIRLNADTSKMKSEEVAKSLDVSLNPIYTYRSDGVRTLILRQTTE